MSTKLAIMAGLAVTFGATSYFAGNQYLENQAKARLNQIENGNAQSAAALTSIVVTTAPLKFGEPISAETLKLVPWPKEALPEGTYSTIEAALGNGERKAIKSIEANEPVLAIKLTGEDGRAGLAGLIADGMRAVTIGVDIVKGVGGFVQPGDRVDIVFTQRDRKNGEQTANIIMENVKVLSVDQQADSRTSDAKVAKSVTLETDAAGAQRLALSRDVGKLSLILRGAGDTASVGSSQLSLSGDSNTEGEGTEGGEANTDSGILSFLTPKEDVKKHTSIKIVRGDEVKTENVPILKQIKIDAVEETKIQ